MTYDINKVINIAKKEIGYLEKKTNSNLYDKIANAGFNNYTKYAQEMDTKYPNFYNGKKNGYSWCDCFVDWCFIQAYGEESAKTLLCQPSKSCGAGCTASANYYKNKGQLYSSPKVGDQIFFIDSSGSPGHTGIVYDVDAAYVYTIEGNTSSASGVVSNGGAVEKKVYKKNYTKIYGYGRPAYGTQPKTTSTTTSTANTKPAQSVTQTKSGALLKSFQKAAIADGYGKYMPSGADGIYGKETAKVLSLVILKKQSVFYTNKNLTKFIQTYMLKFTDKNVDGKFGNDTRKAVIKWQASHKLEADGVVGELTLRKLLGL